MKIAKTIWDLFVIILELAIIGIICYVIFRMFTMSNLEAAKFNASYRLAGIDGYINYWIYDIRTAIHSIL